MKKRLIGLVFVFSLCISAFAHADNIRVFVDNNEIIFDQPPIIENDRTLVPLRAIFEALGAEVEWNSETRSI
ncbi:MAG: copper amine oxidase N-terminal domain-containing protein, partial [Firmicutes bacterium]|nr:copper amine oxidase N-terminal domain-containing protein [Bacillota bacterium]